MVRITQVARALSRACDVASGRPFGFAQRVARTALRLASMAPIDDAIRADLLLAALWHSAGLASVGGDVARIFFDDERALLRAYPLDALFDQLAVGADIDADGEARTGVYMRHHVPLSRFPLVTAGWLSQLGLDGAAAIVSTMLDLRARQRQPMHVGLPSGLLSLAYHMVAVRWMSTCTLAVDPELVESCKGFIKDPLWLDDLAGVLFEESLIDWAEAVWTDDQFWQEMDAVRTATRVRLDALPKPSSTAADKVEIDRLLGSYIFTANELSEDVPDVDEAVMHLLAPRFGAEFPIGSPILDGWFQLLGLMSDAKSVFEPGHAQRVANLAQEVGKLLEIDDGQIAQLRLAAWVYSAGKLALPSVMLEQGSGLTRSQRAMLREVPRVTRATMAPIEALRDAIEQASCYAERLDGSGYPEGLRSAEIPLFGRLLAVVDTFESLQSDRPYRLACSRARALHILQAQSGRLFDGVLTDLVEGITRGVL